MKTQLRANENKTAQKYYYRKRNLHPFLFYPDSLHCISLTKYKIKNDTRELLKTKHNLACIQIYSTDLPTTLVDKVCVIDVTFSGINGILQRDVVHHFTLFFLQHFPRNISIKASMTILIRNFNYCS